MRLRDGKLITNDNDVYTENNISGEYTETMEHRKEKSDKNEPTEPSNLEGDYLNVSLLLLLYVLQGVPLGMAGSLPMILQNKKISYKQQAVFSFVYWPFSLKLLWAPIVDAVFVHRMGRRKTWLVPIQYLIGIFMLLLSSQINDILESDIPNVLLLTVVFFSLNFLAATQDIAVDGWALTMLQKRNVGYASTCNSVGQTAGYFVGNVVLLAFSSPEFCNKYLRLIPQEEGVITLAGFLFFWGIIFLVTTTLVWLLKHEQLDSDAEDHGIIGTYLMLVKIVKRPAVQELIIILLTVKVGFAAADAVTGLKLIEAGVKKETLALLAVPLVPLQILLPLVIARFTTGPRPLDVFKTAIPFRLCFGIVFALLVYWTPYVRAEGQEEFPYYYFAVILIIYGFHQITVYSMFVSIMAFFARVSDPAIGGTYMTMLNTITNLGGNWSGTLILWLVDPLTWKQCSTDTENDCSSQELIQIFVYTMFVGQYTFIMSRVCVHQPEIGGTYLTLLNSCSNMGAKWTKTLVLYVVEGLTVKDSAWCWISTKAGIPDHHTFSLYTNIPWDQTSKLYSGRVSCYMLIKYGEELQRGS